MYLLWVVAIIAVLAATFTNYKYADLDAIAGVLLFFAFINSFLTTTHAGKSD